MPSHRRRLATGIYADPYGISVILPQQGRKQEHRFDPGTPLDTLVRWRTRQLGVLAETHPAPARGTLARDIVRYLKRLKGRPGYVSEKSHLRAWLAVVGNVPRHRITTETVDLAIARWRDAGYAARTVRHRCRVLDTLYRKLDGRRAPTPVDEATLPAKPKPRPVSIADDVIERVALELRKHEITRTLRDMKTRARFLVLATHSQRPVEVQRAQRVDVDFDRGLWFVRGAKGGVNTVVPLNAEQQAAWRLFAAARAWGAYDGRSFVRTIQRCGWPKGIRPYNLRHSTGVALSRRGVDLGDIQQLFGHTSPVTTRQFYVPGLIERLADATSAIEGRFGTSAFVPRLPPATSTAGHASRAKVRQSSAKNEGGNTATAGCPDERTGRKALI